MQKLLPFLFAALLGSGCSKSSADPAPAADLLLGRWVVASDVRTVYTTTGAVSSTIPATIGIGLPVELTATQYVAYTGSFAPVTQDYTRAGNMLHFGMGTAPSDYATIVELTANRMVWTKPVATVPTGAASAIFTTTFTR